MKLCKDCFYCQKYDSFGNLILSNDWKCSQVMNENPVDGVPTMARCSVERGRTVDFAPCGVDGKLFEDRKEREREIKYDAFPKEVDSNGDWIV